ncbi:hypothetical protein FUAX_50090 (plasmid) [Fulvitalea axinellae]|uniref:Helix-turn-helix domain-containing protein n=1 Tax=Fulvitalea axinellae TaxID=1182444 RepID=A0AAU9D571_9BACT|nr:hypothetical protein FUAX_50090 [Fulvitalea axinellae]
MLQYTHIRHNVRLKLRISWEEYALCDYVHFRSNSPRAKGRQCLDSRVEIADFLGVSPRTLTDMIAKMQAKGLITRSATAKYGLKPGPRWTKAMDGQFDDTLEIEGEEEHQTEAGPATAEQEKNEPGQGTSQAENPKQNRRKKQRATANTTKRKPPVRHAEFADTDRQNSPDQNANIADAHKQNTRDQRANFADTLYKEKKERVTTKGKEYAREAPLVSDHRKIPYFDTALRSYHAFFLSHTGLPPAVGAQDRKALAEIMSHFRECSGSHSQALAAFRHLLAEWPSVRQNDPFLGRQQDLRSIRRNLNQLLALLSEKSRSKALASRQTQDPLAIFDTEFVQGHAH